MTNSSQVTQPQLWLLVSIVGLTFLVLSLGYLLISRGIGKKLADGVGPFQGARGVRLQGAGARNDKDWRSVRRPLYAPV